MAVAVSDLVSRLKASMNVPGSTFFDVDDAHDAQWAEIIGGEFWFARAKRYFTDYRLSVDGTEIVTVAPATDDMPGELQQIIVVMARLVVLKAKILELETSFSVKGASGAEFATERSATVLAALLKAAEAELKDLHNDLVANPAIATQVGIIDLAQQRLSGLSPSWVSA